MGNSDACDQSLALSAAVLPAPHRDQVCTSPIKPTGAATFSCAGDSRNADVADEQSSSLLRTPVVVKSEAQVSRHPVIFQVYFPIAKEHGTDIFRTGQTPEEIGIINQQGLNGKTTLSSSPQGHSAA
ncbi:hypothetical protein BV20DRAFT_777124 [Pilatotrama ljubarskyi]|nr:hypothetical protein BV20DRAFT_777124 [Pilatotrama ljubarskyi]